MPCFLFTYHAHGSWMPDREQGYVKRGKGILPTDSHMNRLYTESMVETAVLFDSNLQIALIECLLESAPKQKFELYAVATDSTHVHALLSWRDQRRGTKLRGLVKGSLTRYLNKKFERRTWLAESGSCKQVKHRGHFDHLKQVYLPKHQGWKWDRERGFYR